MSYDPAGIYNLPPAYKAEPGTTIRSEQHNAPLEDIAQALSSVLVRDGRSGMIGTLQMGGYPISNVAPGTAATDAATVSQLVPIGTVVDYAGSTAPAGWLFCAGQAVSRSTYAALFAVIGTTYGNGNGSTTFNLPDLRGRVVAGRDNMGGTSAARLSSISGNTLGGAGGAQTHTLTVAQIPAHNHSISLTTSSNGGHTHSASTGSAGAHTHSFSGTTASAGAHTHGIPGQILLGNGSSVPGPTGTSGDWFKRNSTTSSAGAHTHSFSGTTASAGAHTHTVTLGSAGAHTHSVSGSTGNIGSGQAHPNVQPTIILNKIIKATN